MSSDGIRKATLGWEISPTGGMTNNGGKVVAIEEVPAVSSGAIAIESGAIVIDEPPPLPVPPVQMEPRPRRTTLERFNDEMAVLERPLEGEVEYIDEKPPRRWRHYAAFAATVAIVGGGGAFLISHHRAAVAARVERAPEAPAARAQAPTVAQPVAQPVLATQVTPVPGAAAAAPAVADAPAEDDAADDGADAAPVAPSAWSKVKTGHGTRVKHARVVTGKSHHRTSKRAVAAKHTRHR
ncbi:MAG TPA: hypothetical protein VKQ32_10565 [Polyangia bacterium]|nr:hypothetical protein [Polyangia bacterium]